MNLTEKFITRPIATSLIMTFILVAGVVAYRYLGVATLPSVDLPTVRVVAQLAGASPDTMAKAVAIPLERQLGVIAGVEEMTSVSAQGMTIIYLQFSTSRSSDTAALDVNSAVNATMPYLPADMLTRPLIRVANPNMIPVMIFSITSTETSPSKLYDYADTVISQKLLQVPGVADVIINGAEKAALRISVNPTSLTAMGMTLSDIRNAVQLNNMLTPMGSIEDQDQSMLIEADSQLNTPESLRKLAIPVVSGVNPYSILSQSQSGNSFVVQNQNPAGRVAASRTQTQGQNLVGKSQGYVSLSSVARVESGVANRNMVGWYNNRLAVLMMVLKRPNANVVETADAIKATLPAIQKALPASIDVQILSDRTETIRSGIAHLQGTLFLTTCLVIMSMLIFLRRLGAALIPSAAIPVSVAGSFIVMYFLDYTLDNLSLMALTVATGFIVDDAIIMVENITRWREQGYSPVEAAKRGARQIVFTIISMTVSLVAVFIPILFVGGITGMFFRAFGVTICSAILISALVSLSLTPMLCAYFLGDEGYDKSVRPKNSDSSEKGWKIRWGKFSQKMEHYWDRLVVGYGKMLHQFLAYRKLSLLLTFLIAAGTIYLYGVVHKDFAPTQDSPIITATTEGPPDIAFAAMAKRQAEIGRMIMADPAVENFSSFVGGGGSNSGMFYINLKDRALRDPSSEVARRMNEKMRKVTGISAFFKAASDFQRGARASKGMFQYTVAGNDSASVKKAAKLVVEKFKTLPQLRDVDSDQADGSKQFSLKILRDAASKSNIAVQSIDDALYNGFGQRPISLFYTPINFYRILLEIDPKWQDDLTWLQLLSVPSDDGSKNVPLSSVTKTVVDTAPVAVAHQAGAPAVTVTFNMAPKMSLSDITNAIDQAMSELILPEGVRGNYAGDILQYMQSGGDQLLILLAAIIVVYLVLGILYESYAQPLTILSTIPSAGLGALLALLITDTPFSLFPMIGILMLVGIAKKNAIMMVDFALEARAQRGLSPEQAIIEAALVRFRPIMMTSVTAILGALPLALDSGPGSELRASLGITLVGGLLVSQTLTLFTTPVVFLALEKRREKRKAKKRQRAEARRLATGLIDVNRPLRQ
ncbi:MAG: efflux RND transporter permease subunit [Alphaproteobacteria bacterium]|nr:efflux RND transporter permease subunit [Alphaproteobacteria bacterium]